MLMLSMHLKLLYFYVSLCLITDVSNASNSIKTISGKSIGGCCIKSQISFCPLYSKSELITLSTLNQIAQTIYVTCLMDEIFSKRG